jgi:hypothetical protein
LKQRTVSEGGIKAFAHQAQVMLSTISPVLADFDFQAWAPKLDNRSSYDEENKQQKSDVR